MKSFLSFNSSGLNPKCSVALLVKRGTSLTSAPGRRLTLKCPVKHCGERVKVGWCKESDKCADIPPTDNMEITQASSSDHGLTAFLTFRSVSPEDSGLYRCSVKEDQNQDVSHAITVVVSGMLGLNAKL